jgi:hypothetical protein
MLDGLDAIPWANLRHAYGAAQDVPELLRALAQPEKWREAISELFGNIWHQGTVYEASSYAVPFLIELAAEPSVEGRGEILGLIGTLADGSSYLDVHARPDLHVAELFRNRPDFEEQLGKELGDVQRTRLAVLQGEQAICRLLKDAQPMVRAGAAYVLSQFPERAGTNGALLRHAVAEETNTLVLAALIWCLGAIRDGSPETRGILELAIRGADPRQAFAAAVAMFRVDGERHAAALPIYRQMAAAKWIAEGILVGVPWDALRDFHPEELLAGVEPDPIGATRALLVMAKEAEESPDLGPAIVHDLLDLNFECGDWRKCARLTETQATVLRCLVETDGLWATVSQLWFLIPGGARKLSEIKASDIQNVREEMRLALVRAGRSSI